jgi:hypothetical protein
LGRKSILLAAMAGIAGGLGVIVQSAALAYILRRHYRQATVGVFIGSCFYFA